MEALEVAKQLGEKVIVLGTSHGGALSLALAEDQAIAALVLYGPNIEVFDPKAKLLSKPWGLQIARLVKGGKYHYMWKPSEEKQSYWTAKTRLEATTHMQKFLDVKMFGCKKVGWFSPNYYNNNSFWIWRIWWWF